MVSGIIINLSGSWLIITVGVTLEITMEIMKEQHDWNCLKVCWPFRRTAHCHKETALQPLYLFHHFTHRFV